MSKTLFRRAYPDPLLTHLMEEAYRCQQFTVPTALSKAKHVRTALIQAKPVLDSAEPR